MDHPIEYVKLLRNNFSVLGIIIVDLITGHIILEGLNFVTIFQRCF